MSDIDSTWLIKRRHEDLSQTFRTSWDLYIKFYTVFLTFSIAALGLLLSRNDSSPAWSRSLRTIATVFIVQTILTAITSGAMALYSTRVARCQAMLESQLPGAPLAVRSAVPVELTLWAGLANCAAMFAMVVVWVRVGFSS